MKFRFPENFRDGGLLALVLVVSSCNALDWADSPGTPEQYESAARACIDQGDFTCARENYEKLTGDAADIGLSLAAYAKLEENGFGMEGFLRAIINTQGKGIFKEFAQSFHNSQKTYAVNAKEIFAAYKSAESMSASADSKKLKNFALFLSATALASSILGENVGTDGILAKTDIAAANACERSGCELSTVDCAAPAENKIELGSSVDLATLTADTFPTTPTYFLFQAAA
jgi:hypothetical protein